MKFGIFEIRHDEEDILRVRFAKNLYMWKRHLEISPIDLGEAMGLKEREYNDVINGAFLGVTLNHVESAAGIFGTPVLDLLSVKYPPDAKKSTDAEKEYVHKVEVIRKKASLPKKKEEEPPKAEVKPQRDPVNPEMRKARILELLTGAAMNGREVFNILDMECIAWGGINPYNTTTAGLKYLVKQGLLESYIDKSSGVKIRMFRAATPPKDTAGEVEEAEAPEKTPDPRNAGDFHRGNRTSSVVRKRQVGVILKAASTRDISAESIITIADKAKFPFTGNRPVENARKALNRLVSKGMLVKKQKLIDGRNRIFYSLAATDSFSPKEAGYKTVAEATPEPPATTELEVVQDDNANNVAPALPKIRVQFLDAEA